MPYRFELASTGRAVCKGTECNKEKIKIEKGELRFGSLVTIQEHTSWTWKHLGCTTPAQVAHLQEESGGDTDMVDGYDELPAEHQEKIKYALENGHVPDEDWKGDVECNRVGAKGFRVKAKKEPKKKGKKAVEADEDANDAEEPKPQKKRGRAAKEEDDKEEAPAPKKARGRAKKAAPKAEVEDPESEVEQPKPKKSARGKKAAVYKEVSEDEDEEVAAPKPKRGRKKADADDKPAPKKGGRKKKAAAGDD